MRREVLIWVGALVLTLCPAAQAENAAVGDEAPEITATAWLNTEDGESPLEGDADPKLILLEFWGTWCGPCVRTMPKIQALWEKFRDMRVMVVAMTRETPGDVRSFLKEKGYTMPVACDPSQTCISQYGLQGWPTTVLIDRDGKVIWRGTPSGAEEQVEKGLGLESSPTTLLKLHFDACVGSDKDVKRAAMERLVEKAPAAFDLKSFAESVLGDPPDVEAVAKPLKAKAALKVLDKLQKAWSDEAKREPLLIQLATGEHEKVDLAAWIAATYRKAYPFKAPELKELPAAKKYAVVIDMFVRRAPSGSLYKTAGKDEGLVAYCDKRSSDAWTFARKAKMGRMYWMSDGPMPEGFDSDAFSRDISINGIMTNNERNVVVGIIIGGEHVMQDAADAYTVRQISRFFIMNAIAAGNALAPAKLEKKVNAEIEKIVKALRAKYG